MYASAGLSARGFLLFPAPERDSVLVPGPAPKPQKGRPPPLGQGLDLVARGGPIGRPLAPVPGPPGEPFIGRVIGQALEHPSQIIPMVGRQAQLGAVRHCRRQAIEKCGLEQPALVVAALWPGVGKQDEDAREHARRKDIQKTRT